MSDKGIISNMLPITMAAMLSIGFVSCSEIDDISYQPHLPINESHSFEGYDFLSVDAEEEWTWMTDRKALKEVAYPIPHNEHPSHKKMEIYGDYVVEKKGKLKYVKHPLISNYQYPAIIKSVDIPTAYIDIVKAAKAYREDRYDIQDDPEAEHLEWLLGLRKDYDNKLFKSKETGNPIADVFQSEMGEFVNSMLSPSISNWLEQISNDGDLSREDCKFLYTIERHDETSFDYIYLDQEGKSSYTIRKTYECNYDISDLNISNASSFTNLYEAVKNSVKYTLVDCPTSISIDLYPKGDESLLDDNYQVEEAIFKYKFNDTYNYPDGFIGFKKDICQILLDTLTQHYEEEYDQEEAYIYKSRLMSELESVALRPSLYGESLDSLYKSSLVYDKETGEVSLGEKRILDGEYDVCNVIDNVPNHLREDIYVPSLLINMAVSGNQITDLQITDPKRAHWNNEVIFMYLGNKTYYEMNKDMLKEAIRQRIKLKPKKEGIISFISFPLNTIYFPTSVERYLELLQDSVNVCVKELEASLKEEGEDLYYLDTKDRANVYHISGLRVLPKYPGYDSFQKGIIEHVRKQVPALRNGGGVTVYFEVNHYGKVCRVSSNAENEELDKQIKAAFETLPLLKPAGVRCRAHVIFE